VRINRHTLTRLLVSAGRYNAAQRVEAKLPEQIGSRRGAAALDVMPRDVVPG
jgi:hypothetical protein